MATAIDNFGRAIEQNTMGLDQLRGLIASLMQGKTGKAQSRNEAARAAGFPEAKELPKQTGELEKIREILKNFDKSFGKTLDEMEKYSKQIAGFLQEIAKGKSGGMSGSSRGKQPVSSSKAEMSMSKQINNLHKHATKKGSLYVYDLRVDNTLKQILAAIEGGSLPSRAASGGGGGGGRSGGGGSGAGAGGGGGGSGNGKKQIRRTSSGLPALVDDANQDLWVFQDIIGRVQSAVFKLEKSFLGFGVMGTILNDVVDQEREFTQNVRAAAYEIAGVTKETRALQKEYETLGDTVKFTGKNRTEFQQNYIGLLKKGVKDQKTAVKIGITQLNTEEQLGLKAESLQETFLNWHEAMGMNTNQLAEMGRGMRDVARYTGLTGESLVKAVQSSESFIKNLRNAATLTASAAKNIMEISANAQKLGIAEQMDPLMRAMTSTNVLFKEANQQTKSLLFGAAAAVGKIEDLQNGTILKSKEGIKAMAKGLESQLRMFGVESLEAIDNLSEAAKRDLNLQIKAAFGIELGEFKRVIETMKESGKGMADRLADINKKRQQNLTLEEKAALMEEERRLKTSKSLEMLTALDEAAKGANSMADALGKFGQRRKDFEGDLNAMGVAWTSNAEAARGAIEQALGGVNKSLRGAGKKELNISSREIEDALRDPAAFRELTSRLSKAEQEAATASKAQLDPMTAMKQSLSEINDNIRQFTQGAISKVFNSMLGQLMIIGAVLAVIAAQSFLAVSQFALVKQSLGKFVDMVRNGSRGQGGPGLLGSVASSFSRKSADPNDNAGFFTKMKEFLFTGRKMPAQDRLAEETHEVAVETHKTAEASARTAKAVEKMNQEATKACDPCGYLKSLVEIAGRISDCVCRGAKTAATGGGAADKSAIAVEKSKRRHEEKQIKHEKWKLKQEKNNLLAETKTVKQQGGGGLFGGDGMEFDVKSMMKQGKEMAKVAIAITIVAAGAMALGAAIVAMGAGILGAFNLDAETAMKTAGAVAAVIVAAGAIAVAAAGVMYILQKKEVSQFSDKIDKKAFLKSAAGIMLITPLIVGLAAALLVLIKHVSLGVGWDQALETAGTVAAIIGAAAAIAVGINEMQEPLQALGQMFSPAKVKEMLINMGKGALALFILAPVITLLAAGLIKIIGAVMGMLGIDTAKAAEVGKNVGAMILAAGAISLGVIAAMAGLYGLGLLAGNPVFWKFIWVAAIGAAALMALAPAVVLIAAGVLAVTNAATKIMGVDGGKAKEIADNVGGVIMAAGLISLGVLASLAGLYGLGLLVSSPMFWTMLPFAQSGAIALMLLTPAVTLIAAAVLYIAAKSAGMLSISGDKASEIAENLGNIILAAGKIALGVLGSVAGLAGLGALGASGTIWLLLAAAALGVGMLMSLTPIVVKVAAAVIELTKSVMNTVLKPEDAAKAAESVAKIMESAGTIASEVLKATGKLSALGAFALMAPFIALAMMVGVGTLMSLTGPVVLYILAVKKMSDTISSVMNIKEAESRAKTIATVLGACATITEKIIEVKDRLVNMEKYGSFWNWLMQSTIADQMDAGTKTLLTLKNPLVNYLGAIIEIDAAISQYANARGAAARAQNFAVIMKALGDISKNIVETKDSLTSLSKMNGFWSWFSSTKGVMQQGVDALKTLKEPLVNYLLAIIDIDRSISQYANARGAAARAQNFATVMKALGDVTGKIMEAKDAMRSLKRGGGWFDFSDAADQMRSGVEVLRNLRDPMAEYMKTIMEISGSANVSEMSKYQKSIENLQLLSRLTSAVPSFLQWVTDRSGKNNVMKNAATASDYFKNIAYALKEGVIRPVNEFFPEISVLNAAATKLELINNIITQMAEIMEKLGSSMQKLNGSKVDLSSLNSVDWEKMGRAVSSVGGAGGDPSSQVIAEKLAKNTAEAQKDSASAMQQLLVQSNKVDGLNVSDMTLHDLMREALYGQSTVRRSAGTGIGTLTPGNEARAFEKGITDANGKPISGSRLAETMNIEQETKKALMGQNGGFVSRIQDAAVQSLANIPQSISTNGDPASAGAAAMSAQGGAMGVGGSVIALNKAQARMSGGNALAVMMDGPAAQTKTSATTMPNGKDIHSEIEREVTSSQPSTVNASSAELAQIAAATEKEAIASAEMVELLHTLVDIFTPTTTSVGGGGGAGTSAPGVPVASKPPNYWGWTTGKFNQGAGKGVVNMMGPGQ